MSRAFRLGLFVVGTLAILGLGVFLIGRKQLLFSSTYELRSDFNNVAGLGNGAQVRVGGIYKGTVNRIQLPSRPDQKVTVILDMESETRSVIKKDSMASIKTEGLLGNKFVEITFGSHNGEAVRNGDSIPSEPPLELADLIKKTNDILDSTRETMSDVSESANDLKSVASKINQGTGTIGSLINDKTVYQRAAAGMTAFDENMQALKRNFLLRGFFRNRGYEDSTQLARHEIQKLPSETPLKRFAFEERQIFDKPDTAKLKNQKSLNEAGRYLEGSGFGLAVVMADTSLQGDSQEQKVLAQARAMVVRNYLAENFKLDDARLRTMGMGERQGGGRVEIVVYPSTAQVSRTQNNSTAGTRP